MSSQYFRSLKEEYRQRYVEKLTYRNVDLPDPLDEDIKNAFFTSKRLPSVSIFGIYSYLVEKHHMYTQLAFNNYEALPCYNYVVSGKVKQLKCFRNDTVGVSVIQAKVGASQTAKKIHLPWVVVKNDGEVISAHCTCMAGLGETCSHVGAVLFYIRENIEKPACTSEPCKWNRTSTNVEPALVAEIDFSKPKAKRLSKKQISKVLPVASDDAFKHFLKNVKIALPTAPVLNVFPDSDNESTDSAEEVIMPTDNARETTINIRTFRGKVSQFIQSLPPTYSKLEKQKAFLETFALTQEDIASIEQNTRQNEEKWKDERVGRITASKFGRVLHFTTSCKSLLKEIMDYPKDLSHIEAIAWGKAMEKVARDKFFRLISPLHVNFSIQPTGLFVDKESYLGATPDGIVSCDCCEEYILEIKCPYSHRESNLTDIPKKNFFLDDNNVLKEKDQYYHQVQGQMALSGIKRCYFVTYTKKELHHQIIDFDEEGWLRSKDQIRHFFFSEVFPKMVGADYF